MREPGGVAADDGSSTATGAGRVMVQRQGCPPTFTRLSFALVFMLYDLTATTPMLALLHYAV